mgnify:FL=1
MLKVKFNELLADSLGDGFKTELATGACIASGNTAEKIPAMAVLIKGEAIQMLSYYALPLCGEEYIDISEELSDESDADDVLAFKNEILAKVYSYILRTQDYYSKLISLYETMGDKLMKEVMTKYGTAEMPQSATMDSILTSQENDLSRVRIQLNESGTPMERLAEIQESYRSLYREWAEDFASKFIVYPSGGEGECYE